MKWTIEKGSPKIWMDAKGDICSLVLDAKPDEEFPKETYNSVQVNDPVTGQVLKRILLDEGRAKVSLMTSYPHGYRGWSQDGNLLLSYDLLGTETEKSDRGLAGASGNLMGMSEIFVSPNDQLFIPAGDRFYIFDLMARRIVMS
jgi:hypothetical protein